MSQVEMEKVLGLIAEHGARMVDLRFTSLLGTMHHVTIPADK